MASTLMRNDHPLIPALSGEGIGRYVGAVNAIPMLSAEEERELGRRLQRSNDLDAARRLILAHLRFVVRIARGYTGYGLALPDLIQEGNVGLMKAVKRFDPLQGVRLAAFAVHWIRAEIYEFVLRNWRIVKVATTKAQRKLFFNLHKAKKHLGWLSGEEAAGVAEDLGVTSEDVLEMEQRLAGQDLLFDVHAGDEDDERPAPVHYLQDLRDEPATRLEAEDWEDKSSRALYEALDGLDPRARDIVQRRWLAEEKATLHELAAEYGVSAERIRQLENAAFRKLRQALAL